MKNVLYFISLVLITTFFISCKKEEGVGGNSSITGTIQYRKYDPTLTTLITTYPAQDENVYIQYGDNDGVSDKVATDYNGKFTFSYLYPGSYTLWVYSDDTTFQNSNGTLVVKNKVELGKKESQDLGQIYIAGTK